MAELASRRANVLIVEDDEDVASAMRDILEDEGFDASVAHTVAEATKRFDVEPPVTLVLLDWNLPDGSGEDVVRAIRPRNASVPIVVMSAARDALRSSAVVDARERIAKPFSPELLVAMVKRYA